MFALFVCFFFVKTDVSEITLYYRELGANQWNSGKLTQINQKTQMYSVSMALNQLIPSNNKTGFEYFVEAKNIDAIGNDLRWPKNYNQNFVVTVYK